MGVLTESAEFYVHMSALQNLRFLAALYDVEGRDRPEELLATFGSDADQAKPVATFSTGLGKRLGLAKALLNRPALLFLDESTKAREPTWC